MPAVFLLAGFFFEVELLFVLDPDLLLPALLLPDLELDPPPL